MTAEALGIDDPSLPLVTLNLWIENFETAAIFRKISEAGASESMVMASGRPLIGRPGGLSASEAESRGGAVLIELYYRNTNHAGVPQ